MNELKKKSKRTLKQSKWLKVYLETGNATEAAMQVYNCKNRVSARQIGWENITKLDFSDFLEEAGVTDKLLQQKLMEGLNADKSFLEMEVPDFAVRHKYLETALKLKRRLNTKEGDMNIKEAKILVMPTQLIDKYGIDNTPEKLQEK